MITATDSAAAHIRSYIERRGKGIGIRLSVRNSGCSGLSYVIEVVEEILPNHASFNTNGVTILVDHDSLVYVDGTELDYEINGLNEGLVFNNPRETARCGCGETFSVE